MTDKMPTKDGDIFRPALYWMGTYFESCMGRFKRYRNAQVIIIIITISSPYDFFVRFGILESRTRYCVRKNDSIEKKSQRFNIYV